VGRDAGRHQRINRVLRKRHVVVQPNDYGHREFSSRRRRQHRFAREFSTIICPTRRACFRNGGRCEMFRTAHNAPTDTQNEPRPETSWKNHT
jgi:hypothetical protein